MRRHLLWLIIGTLCAFPVTAQNTANYMVQGGGEWVVGGTLTIADGATFSIADSLALTLGADELFSIDAVTTSQTQTAGAFDLNFGSATAGASGFNLGLTQPNGTASGVNVHAMIVTLTGNDADGDVDGITMTAAATANAAAGTYEYGFSYDCVENTAGACLDGILITSSGIDTGMTDGLDVSASNIVNAISIGSNKVLGDNGEFLQVGSADNIFTFSTSAAGGPTLIGADDAGAAITTLDTSGTGSIVIGSADVTAITLSTDATGDSSDVVMPTGAVDGTEVLNDTLGFADFANTSTLDADLTVNFADGLEIILNPAYTTGDSEGLSINLSQVDDGAATDDAIAVAISLASESGDGGDTIRGITITGANGTANTVFDAAIAVDNAETTTATMTDAIIITSSGVAGGVVDAVDASAANITNALNIGANEIHSDGVVTFGRDATGSITLTATDDDAVADMILDAGTTGAITIGSGDVTAVTVSTDNTGDGSDLVLPAQSVQAAEILNDTLDGAQLADTITLDAALAIEGGAGLDVTLNPATGNGNRGYKNELIGLPRIALRGLGAGTNPAGETVGTFVDDSPTGECAPKNANNTEAEGSADSIYRVGASSYKSLFSAATVADDGFRCTFVADSFEPNASVGIWVYSSVVTAAADLQLVLYDDAPAERVFAFPVGLTAATWTWVEFDVTALAGGTGDLITEVGVTLTAAGAIAQGAFDLYLDTAWKWSVADEDALGTAVLQDGVLSVVDGATGVLLAEGTDYLVHYEPAANDYLVWITNQSAVLGHVALVAY